MVERRERLLVNGKQRPHPVDSLRSKMLPRRLQRGDRLTAGLYLLGRHRVELIGDQDTPVAVGAVRPRFVVFPAQLPGHIKMMCRQERQDLFSLHAPTVVDGAVVAGGVVFVADIPDVQASLEERLMDKVAAGGQVPAREGVTGQGQHGVGVRTGNDGDVPVNVISQGFTPSPCGNYTTCRGFCHADIDADPGRISMPSPLARWLAAPLAVLALSGCAGPSIDVLPPPEEGLLVYLDVRSKDSVDKLLLTSAPALNVPADGADFAERLATLDRSGRYAVFCDEMADCRKAKDILVDAGFEHVWNAGTRADMEAAGQTFAAPATNPATTSTTS